MVSSDDTHTAQCCMSRHSITDTRVNMNSFDSYYLHFGLRGCIGSQLTPIQALEKTNKLCNFSDLNVQNFLTFIFFLFLPFTHPRDKVTQTMMICKIIQVHLGACSPVDKINFLT